MKSSTPKSITPKITVSDEDSSLLDYLKIDPEEFVRLAFDEWVRWIRANKRPTTISEQEVDRLYGIFSQASQKKELNLERLIRDYKFPVGRARFLDSAVRKKYPKILAPEILKMIDLIKSAVVDKDFFRFRIVEERAYIFREIAKDKGWGVEQLKLESHGLGQFDVRVSEDKRVELVGELEGYM